MAPPCTHPFPPSLCSFFIVLFAALFPSSASQVCPLNFTVLENLRLIGDEVKSSANATFKCTSFVQAFHYVLVDYVASSGYFLVPDASAESCWEDFDEFMSSLGMVVDSRSLCNISTTAIAISSAACKNITSVETLSQQVPSSVLSGVTTQCANASITDVGPCSACTTAVSLVIVDYLPGGSNASINSCHDIVSLYASSAQSNSSRYDVASCLFNIARFGDGSSSSKRLKYIYAGVGAAVAFILVLCLVLFFYLRGRKRRKFQEKHDLELSKEKMAKSNANLTWYSISQIKAATNNLSRHNIVGAGGYGNVYKGTLEDGTDIAVKVFKNCSAAGDDDFFHEIEVISSVRHRNLVSIRGCCIEKTEHAGHQRFLICDYMPNGSLNDHLFSKQTQLDWPKRQNIALGIARGLAYLHQEVQPAIIHRDIKPSNILLDVNWNARLADFGLAKFTPDGATHVTTRVAGTQGYVAPEYVLYGQLTEKSDVYSFGIVLLELLTGKKILKVSPEADGGFILMTDWAWSLVKQSRTLEVLDPQMDNLGAPEVLERFILLALFCAHPQVPCRPSIDQVVKMMENDLPLPKIPDRPIAFTMDVGCIEQIVGGSDALSSGSGFQSFSSRGSYRG